jgi:hypothetical protein
MSDEWYIGNNLEENGRGLIRYYPAVCLEGLIKTTINLRISDVPAEL